MSLGGVGYAATHLPANSIGPNQIRNGAVTFKKIKPGAVGIVRANTGQLQARVGGSCNANTAVASIDRSGHVTCNSTLPSQIGTTSSTNAVPTTGTSASIASTKLPSGATFLGLANPTITVTPGSTAVGSQTVAVTCTLGVGSNTDSRTVTIRTPNNSTAASAALPLQLTGTGGTAAVSCSSKPVGTSTAPTVSVTSAVNAIQIH
jgi:hypothetical protein